MDDLVDAPFIDDDERAESEWLLARDNDRDARAPSTEIASDYAEIDDLLGALSTENSDEIWHDEVLRAAVASVLSPRR